MHLEERRLRGSEQCWWGSAGQGMGWALLGGAQCQHRGSGHSLQPGELRAAVRNNCCAVLCCEGGTALAQSSGAVGSPSRRDPNPPGCFVCSCCGERAGGGTGGAPEVPRSPYSSVSHRLSAFSTVQLSALSLQQGGLPLALDAVLCFPLLKMLPRSFRVTLGRFLSLSPPSAL